jgi:LytS/YehU family sensor histidine kinase
MIHENQKNAANMVTALSEILRYSLESSRQEKVHLAEEIAIIERFIAIVKSQMEDRLIFQLNITEQFHEYLIPPMVLQMLIENGIKHGLENIKQGGELTVTCYDDDHKLYFQITNDLPQGLITKPPTTGIGLKNIRKRLELLYGCSGELLISNTQNKFIATLTIPKETS